MTKIAYYWDRLNTSFWFIPFLLLLGSVGMAFLLLYIDRIGTYTPEGIALNFVPKSANTARIILSTITGAMISVAGTVFSITLVALTLASGQFGSRLLRNFMFDRINQVVLGSYISTFVFCLIVLNTIHQIESISNIPMFSLLFAELAAIINILLLIIFIHHIAKGIQSDNVIADISKSMSQTIKRLFPKNDSDTNEHFDMQDIESQYSYAMDIQCIKSGYIQSIDKDQLIDLAKEEQALIKLDFRPGDHILERLKIGRIYVNKNVDDIHNKVHAALIIDRIRTPYQDPEFAIHQMVEIAVRALSPGINDPYTAIACIDNLSEVLAYLIHVDFPSPYHMDDEKKIRLISDSLNFHGVIDAAFNQIRQFAESSPAVLIRLMSSLQHLYLMTTIEEHRNAIIKHANMVMNIAKSAFKEDLDIQEVEKRYAPFLEDLKNDNKS